MTYELFSVNCACGTPIAAPASTMVSAAKRCSKCQAEWRFSFDPQSHRCVGAERLPARRPIAPPARPAH